MTGGSFVAIAHFHAELDDSGTQALKADAKDAAGELKECKFDTLTFEELGGIVRLPTKRTNKRSYDNVEQRLLRIKDCDTQVGGEECDPYYFPADVFDTDVVFVDLPAKV
jgi:hypothetical protein